MAALKLYQLVTAAMLQVQRKWNRIFISSKWWTYYSIQFQKTRKSFVIIIWHRIYFSSWLFVFLLLLLFFFFSFQRLLCLIQCNDVNKSKLLTYTQTLVYRSTYTWGATIHTYACMRAYEYVSVSIAYEYNN